MCSMMNAFSEGIVLADKSGLDPHTLLDVLVSIGHSQVDVTLKTHPSKSSEFIFILTGSWSHS